MGIYDRDYYQDEDQPKGFHFGGGGSKDGRRMMTTNLIIITVVIYIAVELFLGHLKPYSHLALNVGQVKTQPWRAYQFLTYGFMHSPLSDPNEASPTYGQPVSGAIFHILFNMFALFVFGRSIESRLGRREFLAYYLIAIVFSGLVWWTAKVVTQASDLQNCVGASGGVVAVVILFCLFYPRQKLYLFGLIEMPAWLLGVLLVALDLVNSLRPDSLIGWQAHLGGAGFALLYWKLGFRFEKFLPRKGISLKRRPRLKVHDPRPDLADQADRLLDKVHQQGEESLTAKERKILEAYSRRVRKDREES